MENIITCDETPPPSLRMKKARTPKTKFKAMLIVFIDINGIVMTEWVPKSHTINQTYYLKGLAIVRVRVRKKWPELWKNKSWILPYLAITSTPPLEHMPYSSDLAPCDFFLFPKIKPDLNTRFVSMEEVKRKSAELLNTLTKEDFRYCFGQ